MKIVSFFFILLLSLLFPLTVFAQTAIVTPTVFFCVGSNPQPPCATIPPSQSAIVSPTSIPTVSTIVTSPTVVVPQPTVQISQTTDPCSNNQSAVSIKAIKGHRHTNGLISQFIQFLLQLFFDLLRFLIGGNIPQTGNLEPTPIISAPQPTFSVSAPTMITPEIPSTTPIPSLNPCITPTTQISITPISRITPTQIPSILTNSHWLIITNLLNQLNAMDPVTAKIFFNTPHAFVKSTQVSGYSATLIASYTSYAQFSQDLTTGAFPKGVSWVMYGIESTTNSPIGEKQNPAYYLKAFALLAHQYHLQVMEVPGRDLVDVSGTTCHANAGETLDQAYIRCRIPSDSQYADIYLVEAQGDQSNLTSYTNLVQEAVSQVRAVAPAITVMSGLTTDRGDTAQQIYTCWQATHSMVSGYWMNSTSPTLQVADQALQLIHNAGG